eukprot:3025314-Rhodomonas_salina.3
MPGTCIVCYGMSSTRKSYASYAMSGTDLPYAATPCFAMSGTALSYAATLCYAMYGTHISYAAIPCYAMCGTHISYAALKALHGDDSRARPSCYLRRGCCQTCADGTLDPRP